MVLNSEETIQKDAGEAVALTSSEEIPFLPFARPSISEETIEEVVSCLRSGWITTGPRVQSFEADLREYLGAPYALTVSSATAGLYLALCLLDLRPGDQVITPALTFVCAPNTIVQAGGTPVFVDIDPHTYTLDLDQVERALTPKTKAIMPVHYAGFPLDLDRLYALAETHGVRVIEDCAHAIGATYKGKKLGSFGDIQVFSFHPNKNMTTGEGGCITLGNAEEAQRLQKLRFHGIDREAWNRFSRSGSQHYDVVVPGFKCNMMDLQAALGIHQLRALDSFIEQRTSWVQRYQKDLGHWESLQFPSFPDYAHRHAWHLLNPLIRTLDRDIFMEKMKDQGIGIGLHYSPICPLFTYYRERYGYKPGDFPRAEAVASSIVSLPLFPGLTEGDYDRVMEALKKVLGAP